MPPGFFSVDAHGEIVYLNATLATWPTTIWRKSFPA